MKRKFVILLVVFNIVFMPSLAFASDDSELILKILIKKGIITQEEVDQMRQEIVAEKAKASITAAEAPKTLEDRIASIEKELTSKVGLDKLTSRLKMKGRWAAGYYDSGRQGAFDNGSFQIPEAKIQFSFLPDDINSIIMRMNLNNATFNNLDYFYLDTNILKLIHYEDAPFTLATRIGRFKVDYGEETWSNNPVESSLPSNSAANASGSDEGIQLSGKIGKKYPLGWSTAIMNGNTTTGADNNWVKAFSGKLFYNIIDPLYISGSYYNSGSNRAANSEMSIAGFASPPARTTDWEREMWEVDLRYDFDKGKILVPAYCNSKAFVRLAYGRFSDDVKTGPSYEIDGDYGFVEGLYNITKKLYLASRYSIVALDANYTATLNNVATNRYQRYSIGMGYRWTDNTIFKLGYDWNDQYGSRSPEADDNLLSAIVSSQF